MTYLRILVFELGWVNKPFVCPEFYGGYAHPAGGVDGPGGKKDKKNKKDKKGGKKNKKPAPPSSSSETVPNDDDAAPEWVEDEKPPSMEI